MATENVKIWSFLGGTLSIALTIEEGKGVIDYNARRAFHSGQCHALALAINKLTGWPIKGVGDDDSDTADSPAHCLVYVPALRRYLDIDGLSTKPPRGWRVLNRRVTERAVNKFRYYLEPNVRAAKPFAKVLVQQVTEQINNRANNP